MRIPFAKYQATGNDFVLIDDRSARLPNEAVQAYARLCHRRYGVGADGLILIRRHPELTFEMVYYNSDGRLGSMCGNGGRAAVHYAHRLGLLQHQVQFWAYDGPHQATLDGVTISLQMGVASAITAEGPAAWYVHTGSPHHVQLVQADVATVDVVGLGRSIRHSARYAPDGSNVNFVQVLGHNHLSMRTYERGVEDETYSCGTGVTAAALVYATHVHPLHEFSILIDTPGGQLQVLRNSQAQVFLQGPATHVFDGSIDSTDMGLV